MLKITDSETDNNTLKNLELKSTDWLENSPVCTKVVDPNFNLHYMSRAGIEALKIENITSYYLKPFPLDFYPEEFRESMYAKLQDSKDTGEVRVHEGMIVSNDNKELWFESTISPIYDNQKKLDYFMVVSVAINARKKAEAKDILLKEIHHRIKNNLQLVSSLLSLQVAETENLEFKRIIENSKQRIMAMSLVHEKMYDSDNSGEIYIKPYIEDIISNISSAYITEKSMFDQEIEIDNFKLNLDLLVPCSLILNEIITNIFKYGFVSNPNPCMRIQMRKKGNEISLIIADNGPGMIEIEGSKKSLGLGMKLVKALAVQIKASIEIDSSKDMGVCYTLKFNV